MKKRAGKKIAAAHSPDSRRFDTIDAKLDRIIGAMVTQKEFEAFKEDVNRRLDHLDLTVARLVTVVSNLQKSVQDLLLEYAVVRQQMNRYDRWFKEIAEKLGIELKP